VSATDQNRPITSHLAGKVRQRVRQVGLVYWLDRDGLYTEFVDELIQQHNEGTSPLAVVGLRGSYLETMLQLEHLFDTVDPTPLLLHLPGHNEESVRTTPLLELVRAGKRFRMGLDTLITEAATGQIRPDAIQTFLDSKPADLEAADRWLARELDQPVGGLGVQLELMTPFVVLDQLLKNGQLARRLKDPNDRDGLWTWLEVKLGVDSAWRAESVGGDSALDIAAAVTDWVLCVEYVHDLPDGRHPTLGRCCTNRPRAERGPRSPAFNR
jgi:hypothetical protein